MHASLFCLVICAKSSAENAKNGVLLFEVEWVLLLIGVSLGVIGGAERTGVANCAVWAVDDDTTLPATEAALAAVLAGADFCVISTTFRLSGSIRLARATIGPEKD
jgi:hypothetical protein